MLFAETQHNPTQPTQAVIALDIPVPLIGVPQMVFTLIFQSDPQPPILQVRSGHLPSARPKNPLVHFRLREASTQDKEPKPRFRRGVHPAPQQFQGGGRDGPSADSRPAVEHLPQLRRAAQWIPPRKVTGTGRGIFAAKEGISRGDQVSE